jgi:hypothetical protein
MPQRKLSVAFNSDKVITGTTKEEQMQQMETGTETKAHPWSKLFLGKSKSTRENTQATSGPARSRQHNRGRADPCRSWMCSTMIFASQ